MRSVGADCRPSAQNGSAIRRGRFVPAHVGREVPPRVCGNKSGTGSEDRRACFVSV